VRVFISYSLLATEDTDHDHTDVEDSDKELKRKTERIKTNTKEDSDNDISAYSYDKKSDSSATCSELDKSSDQSSAPGRSASGASDSDVKKPFPKQRKANNGCGQTVAKSASESQALTESAQGINPGG
jgi:hypothetical protein